VGPGVLLAQLIDLYTVVVFIAVIISWLGLPPYNPVVRFTRMATEPLLAPIRKFVPSVGGLDFSPLILLILLQWLKAILL
jgi:YggT family protein